MKNPITLEALNALDAIDKMGSFAAAAESLYKVPSALTYTMKKLESDMGVPLFDRSKQRATLTPAGRLVLEEGREILLATHRLTDSVKQLGSGWEREIKIARDTVIPQKPLFDLILQFNQLEHTVDVTLGVESLGGGWDALHSRRADIVVGTSGELPKGSFNIHKIGDIDFEFVVAGEHPLNQVEGEISIEHLRQYPSVVVADTSQLLPSRDSGLFHSKQVIRVDTMQAKIDAQIAGLGVGFVPQHMLKPYLESGELVRLPCAIPRPAQSLYIAWRKDQHGRGFEWFVKHLCKTKWF